MLKQYLISARDYLLAKLPVEASGSLPTSDVSDSAQRATIANTIALTSSGNHYLTSGSIVMPEEIEEERRVCDELERSIQARERAFDAAAEPR